MPTLLVQAGSFQCLIALPSDCLCRWEERCVTSKFGKYLACDLGARIN